MAKKQDAGLPYGAGNRSAEAAATHAETNTRGSDAALVALEKRFNVLTIELDRDRGEVGQEALTKEVESILTRLDPIERAIMETPACTIAGLGVKARHAAYVLSQYWDAPIDKIDWDARAVRLLIEAICDVARTPLLYRGLRDDE